MHVVETQTFSDISFAPDVRSYAVRLLYRVGRAPTVIGGVSFPDKYAKEKSSRLYFIAPDACKGAVQISLFSSRNYVLYRSILSSFQNKELQKCKAEKIIQPKNSNLNEVSQYRKKMLNILNISVIERKILSEITILCRHLAFWLFEPQLSQNIENTKFSKNLIIVRRFFYPFNYVSQIFCLVQLKNRGS